MVTTILASHVFFGNLLRLKKEYELSMLRLM